jgi:hypothetical protein
MMTPRSEVMPVPKPRFRSDRAAMVAAAIALIFTAGILVLATARTEAAPAAHVLVAVMALAAVALTVWALIGSRADAARRASLDRAVDDEMGRKWAPGFARTVGAYEKPWYLLCGEPGVGKTAALRAGRLPMALGPDGQPVTDVQQGAQGTYLFDWWFFEDAVVLDSAGDLIANTDDRWTAFLARVRAARPHRPVNGLLLAISAADLIAGDEADLRRKADRLASQVAVARRQLRVRFPLYLMITKSDLIPGFADFFPTGSDLKSSFQILGWSDDRDPRKDDVPIAPADVKRGLDRLIADLRRRRTTVEAHTTSGRPDAHRRLEHLDEMFAFPAAAAAALENLGPFVAALLGDVNAADESAGLPPPFFRGVYLTSALRTGEALDAELAKAFGTHLRPAARRAASDRAFFIRDLLLEKIVREAGMVAPLTDLPRAAARRSRLIAAAAAVAAAVVIGGSLVGYHRTAALAKADRDFWDALAAVPPGQLTTQLALFDPTGNYRGATVLTTYERSQQLASTDTASPLLPASARINRDRRAAHADLFRQLALAPALVPGPYAATSVPPARAAAAVMAVLVDTRGDKPIPIATLRNDAAALVPLRANGADRSRVLSLLATGVPAVTDAGAPAATVDLTADERRRIADGAVGWVQADLAARRREAESAVGRSTAATADTLALAEALETFESAVAGAREPEDLVEPVHQFDQAVAAHPAAADVGALDREAMAAAVAPPPELAMIGNAIGQVGDGDAPLRRRLAAMVLEHGDFLATQASLLRAGTRSDRSSDVAATTVREQQRPVDERRTPLVVARANWFHRAATQARDAVATATLKPAEGPPVVALPPLLRQLMDDDVARRQSFGPLAALDAAATRDADRQCAEHLAELSDRAARDAVWTSVRPTTSGGLWPSNAPSAIELSGWMSDQATVESALRDQPPTKWAAARAWVDASHAQLEQIAQGRLAAWREASTGRPAEVPVRTWADVAAVVSARPATRPVVDRVGLAVLRHQGLFPAIRQGANGWAADLTAQPTTVGPRAPVRSFLSDYGFGRDPADDVRARLAADPAGMARLDTLSAAPLEPYWRDTLVRSVSMLSDASRRQTLDALRALREAVVDRYPLSADGSAVWGGDVDDRLRAGLALTDVPASPLGRLVRGTDAIPPAWQAYLATLRGVVAFAQRPPVSWTVTFHATDDATENWAAVAAGPTAAGEPDHWHRFVQHRVVPVTWPAIVGGLSVRVSHDDAGSQPVPVLADVGRPWAVYRMAVSGLSPADDASHVRVVLDRHADPATPVTPAVVPAAP